MATGARGEGRLEADGEVFTILYTNRALADAEVATGKSIMGMVSAFQRDVIRIRDMAELLAVGLEHSRRETRSRPKTYKVDEAYELMDRVGFGSVALVVMEAIAAVLMFDRDKDSDGPPA